MYAKLRALSKCNMRVIEKESDLLAQAVAVLRWSFGEDEGYAIIGGM